MQPLPFWSRLAWRLPATVAGATIFVTLLFGVVVLAGAGFYLARSNGFADSIAAEARRLAQHVAPAARAAPVDEVALERLIGTILRSPEHQIIRLVVQTHGPLSGAIAVFPEGTSLTHTFEFNGDKLHVASALVPTTEEEKLLADSRARKTELHSRSESGGIAVAVPLDNGGALFVRIDPPVGLAGFVASAARLLLAIAMVVALVCGVAAFAVSAFASRWLMREIRPLLEAADAWARGEFQVEARVHGRNELSVLASHLTNMAKKLPTLLDDSRRLAKVDERQRVARDLHDTVRQHLFATSMQLEAARERLKNGAIEAMDNVDQAVELVERCQADLLGTLLVLYPSDSPRLWEEQLLRRLADWSTRESIRVEVDLRPPGLTLEERHELTCVLSEALSNVARHSGARKVRVTLLEPRQGVCRFAVEDDGRGIDENAPHGMGMRSMKERAEILGGVFSTYSRSTLGGACMELTFDVEKE